MIEYKNISPAKFLQEPIFCFTSDMEWSPESAIESLLDLFEEFSIPLTPFVTHHSQSVWKKYSRLDRTLTGVHPNFLPGSTQGATNSAVIEKMAELWPEAIGFRAHSFYDTSPMCAQLFEKGFRYDSNINLFLQPDLIPLRHFTGLIRFPVFWQDDTHFDMPLSYDFSAFLPHLLTPGLKIFNVHPLFTGLNIPNRTFYLEHKHLYETSRESDLWKSYIFNGQGVRSLLLDVLRHVSKVKPRVEYLKDLYLQVN